MDSGPTPKVRLVRCPKCRMLLQEPQNILVYKCGGCDTVLQVKNRKNDANGTTPGCKAAQMKEFHRVYEVGECSSSSQKSVLHSSTECSLDQHEAGHQRISRYHVSKVVECTSSSQKAILNSSGECSLDQNEGVHQRISREHVSESGESGSPSDKATRPSSAECSLDQNRGGNQNIPRDHVSEVGELSSSSETQVLRSLGECSLDQNEGVHQRISREHVSESGESGSPSDKATRPSSAECSLDQNRGGNQNMPRELSSSSETQVLRSSGECTLDQNERGHQRIFIDHVSEGGDSSSHSGKATLPSSAENSLDQNRGGDQKISRDNVSGGRESSSSSQIAIFPSLGECSLDQNDGGDQKISRDYVSEGRESSSSSQIAICPSSGELSFDKNGRGDQKKSRDCSTENSEDVNSSDGDRNNESHCNDSEVCNIKHPGVSNEFCSSNGDALLENEDLSQFSRTNSEVELNEMSSLQAGAKLVVDIKSENDSTVGSLTAKNMAQRENNSTVTSHELAAESFSSDILLSSPEEQPKQRQMNVNLSYQRRDFFSPISKVSQKTENYKAKSPRFRSSYDYDGSVSSYDGTTDDHVPDQHINLHRSTFKAANSVMYERSRRENFLGNSIRNGNSEMQHQAWNLSPAMPDTRPYTTDYRKWGGDEMLGSTGHGFPVSNGTRLHDDEFPSPLPFYQRGYPAGYDSCSTSSPLQDEFHHSSSEQERIKLLRMVYELQDHINKTCHLNGKANRRVSTGVTGKEKYIPAHYSGDIPEDEFFHDLNYHGYPERRRQVRNWPHKVSHIPFSGESTNSRHHVNCSCMHCYPEDLQCSAPLPPPFLSQNKGVRRFHFHPGHSCYNSYSSRPLSPQHFADSEFSIRHCETKSDHQRHEDHHMKEKHHLVKRHLRPTAGGAPFITCYNCLKPLQLPADFLVFKRRFHLLRCGECSNVLKFSLESRTHIVPYTPEAATPPPSQLHDYNDAVNRRNSVSSSRGNSYSAADPVSCSDDYGLSNCKSYSTDGDPVILAPFHNVQGDKDGRNLSYDSSESTKERPQLVRRQPGSRYKNPVETQASPVPSSNKSRSGKVSSEIEELPARTGSPLHRLMGYSSPSQVLRGSDPSSSGTCSHYT